MIYEFRCSKCKKSFERDYKAFSPPKYISCSCGSDASRIISGVRVVYKTGGFYALDNRLEGETFE